MQVWFYTLISVFIVSLISLIGVITLSMKREAIKKVSILWVSFAAGALFGDAFIHLLPKSFEKLGEGLNTSLYVISGILLFFVLEKFLHWRHCHLPESKEHHHPFVVMNLVGDAVHNFVDGLIIGATYLVSLPLGIATTLAIIFHEIPQEIGDFGVLIHGGLSIKKALSFNLLSALVAVVGAIISLTVGARIGGFTTTLLPITAGGFIYIAGSDLIPELKHECEAVSSVRQFVFIVLGITAMALLLFLE